MGAAPVKRSRHSPEPCVPARGVFFCFMPAPCAGFLQRSAAVFPLMNSGRCVSRKRHISRFLTHAAPASAAFFYIVPHRFIAVSDSRCSDKQALPSRSCRCIPFPQNRHTNATQPSFGKPLAAKQAHAHTSIPRPRIPCRQNRVSAFPANSLLSALAPVSHIPLRYSLTAPAETAKPLKHAKKVPLTSCAYLPPRLHMRSSIRKPLAAKQTRAHAGIPRAFTRPPHSVPPKPLPRVSAFPAHCRAAVPLPRPARVKTSSLRRKFFCLAAPECYACRTLQTKSARRRSAPQSRPVPSAA